MTRLQKTLTHFETTRHEQLTEHAATLVSEGTEQRIFFKIEAEPELLDRLPLQAEAFVVALVIPCMEAGEDLVVKHPIDEQLVYNINTQLIPFLCARYPNLSHIHVHAPEKGSTPPPAQPRLNFLAMSCGLDALTAFIELNATDAPSCYRPQALLFNHIGAFGKGQEKYEHDRAIVKKFSSDQSLPLVMIESNLGNFYKTKYTKNYSVRSAAAAWALHGICQHATYASGVAYARLLNLGTMTDIGGLDPVTFPMLSTDTLSVYSSGFQHDRSAKFDIFMSAPAFHGYLNTCLRSTKRKGGYVNCGTCKKCSELLFRAEAINQLAALEKGFNVSEFHRMRRYLEFKLVYNAKSPIPSDNSIHTLAFLKKHGVRVHPVSQVIGQLTAALARLASLLRFKR